MQYPIEQRKMVTTLGLLSDSHGRAQTTQAAVDLLLEHGADVLIHLGDIGTVQVLDTLVRVNPRTGRQVASHIVFGNTDWDSQALGKYAHGLGIAVHTPFGLIEYDGQKVGFTHGHDPSVLTYLIDEVRVDYLLHGHTHVQADSNHGATRVINPGALFRAKRHTAAILQPGVGRCEVIEVVGVTR